MSSEDPIYLVLLNLKFSNLTLFALQGYSFISSKPSSQEVLN